MTSASDALQTTTSGQALGQKGADTRRRLLASAMELIQRGDSLTAAAVSRASKVSAATFYVYFASLADLQLALTEEVRQDMTEVFAVLERDWSAPSIAIRSRELVEAFYDHWRRNRGVLSTRNHQSDLGNQAFTEARRKAAMPIINALAERIIRAHRRRAIPERDAFARSVIIYAAMERLAARNPGQFQDHDLSDDELMRAEAHILSLLLLERFDQN